VPERCLAPGHRERQHGRQERRQPVLLRESARLAADSGRDAKDPDVERASKATANRLIGWFRAALNDAFAVKGNGIESDLAWRKGLKPFPKVDAPRKVFLDEAQTKRLVNVTSGAFRNLVIAALLTGARPPHELAACRAQDFNAKARTLVIPGGKTGPRNVFLTREGVRFFTEITAGKEPGALLLPAEGGEAWTKNLHQRPMQEAVRKAKLPKGATLYSLRHTAASRALASGMNMQLLAENMGTSVRMIEKHYGQFSDEGRRKLIEAGALKLGPKRSNVRKLGPR